MSHNTKNINKAIEIIKKTQIEILELKSTITEIKISLEGLISRFKPAEERIKELESLDWKRLCKLKNREKKTKKSELSPEKWCTISHQKSVPTYI